MNFRRILPAMNDHPLDLRFQVLKSEEAELAQFLSTKTQLSKSECKRVIDFGGVWIQSGKTSKKRLKRSTQIVREHDIIEFFYDKKLLNQPVLEWREIAHHQDWVVCYKPAGMLTQGSPYGDVGSLEWCLKKKYHKIFMVHRLDRETSGLIIFAKNSSACHSLSELFKTQRFEKIYLAETVLGATPAADTIIDYPVEGKSSQTKIISATKIADCLQLKLTLLTGRKHQIRIHLNSIGLPILGDPRYGSGNQNTQGLRLQASEIRFEYQKQNYHFMVNSHDRLFQ
jgi:tRNA pseudouridine32 synthase / 23S rRNA pseudouridine746 synthase